MFPSVPSPTFLLCLYPDFRMGKTRNALFFGLSLLPNPTDSLLLNPTETLATQANFPLKYISVGIK